MIITIFGVDFTFLELLIGWFIGALILSVLLGFYLSHFNKKFFSKRRVIK